MQTKSRLVTIRPSKAAKRAQTVQGAYQRFILARRGIQVHPSSDAESNVRSVIARQLFGAL